MPCTLICIKKSPSNLGRGFATFFQPCLGRLLSHCQKKTMLKEEGRRRARGKPPQDKRAQHLLIELALQSTDWRTRMVRSSPPPCVRLNTEPCSAVYGLADWGRCGQALLPVSDLTLSKRYKYQAVNKKALTTFHLDTKSLRQGNALALALPASSGPPQEPVHLGLWSENAYEQLKSWLHEQKPSAFAPFCN